MPLASVAAVPELDRTDVCVSSSEPSGELPLAFRLEVAADGGTAASCWCCGCGCGDAGFQAGEGTLLAWPLLFSEATCAPGSDSLGLLPNHLRILLTRPPPPPPPGRSCAAPCRCACRRPSAAGSSVPTASAPSGHSLCFFFFFLSHLLRSPFPSVKHYATPILHHSFGERSQEVAHHSSPADAMAFRILPLFWRIFQSARSFVLLLVSQATRHRFRLLAYAPRRLARTSRSEEGGSQALGNLFFSFLPRSGFLVRRCNAESSRLQRCLVCCRLLPNPSPGLDTP